MTKPWPASLALSKRGHKVRYHIDHTAQSLALDTLADLTEGSINLTDAVFKLDGAASYAWNLPYGNAAAMALAVMQEFLLHLANPEADAVQAVAKLRNRLDELTQRPVTIESTDSAAVTFGDALANQGEFWAGVE